MNLDKFLGCILGVAIGDALGLPFETMTAHEIRNKVGQVREFGSPSLNPHIFASLLRLEKGSWSDDTQRTLANTQAFIESRGDFDMDAIAENHVRVFRKEVYPHEMRGWGRASRRSLERLSNGISWKDSGEPNGSGNGVMMSIAPFGLRQSVVVEDMRTFIKQCVDYAKMTHLGTPAIVGGVVHAVAVATLASHEYTPVHVRTFLHFLYKIAIEVEEDLERNLPLKERWKDKISDQIKNIMQYIECGREGRLGAQDLESMARVFFGGTSYAPASFGLSYAVFARSCLNPDNPEPFRAVFDAVNAGGDTDTNASIVGSLVGALHGFNKAIPKNLARDVEGSGELRKLTAKFYYTCDKLRQNK